MPFGQPIILINYLIMSTENSAPKRSESASMMDIFSKSPMTKLTLTDSHDDENNGVNLVWNLGSRESPCQKIRSRTFGHWHGKRWQLSFQLLVYQDITLINPNTIWGVIISIIRTHIKQEFVIFMTPTSISVIGHHFHQQNIYLIRSLCMHLAHSSVILRFISIIPLPLAI